jgi:hypothetical protein
MAAKPPTAAAPKGAAAQCASCPLVTAADGHAWQCGDRYHQWTFRADGTAALVRTFPMRQVGEIGFQRWVRANPRKQYTDMGREFVPLSDIGNDDPVGSGGPAAADASPAATATATATATGTGSGTAPAPAPHVPGLFGDMDGTFQWHPMSAAEAKERGCPAIAPTTLTEALTRHSRATGTIEEGNPLHCADGRAEAASPPATVLTCRVCACACVRVCARVCVHVRVR